MALLPPQVTRRQVLTGIGACATVFVLPSASRSQDSDAGFRLLHARPTGGAKLRGPKSPPTPVWGYDGVVPGPTLRVRQSDELKVRLVNDLPQPTVIHWHGLRLPNAMDGVPHLTQMPVESGATFDYRFTAPDAGTFWYHTHERSSEQMARGLYGILIVDEREPVAVDREIVLVVDDWRLTDNGDIAGGFGNVHDAMMAGRLGQYITLNSEDLLDVPLRTNERVRLRIINTANSRIFTLRFHRHAPTIIALDGQPATPFAANNGAVTLGPGNRVDLILDATQAPGTTTSILVDDLRGGELELGRFVYAGDPPIRPEPQSEALVLPANPLPGKLDLATALRVDVPLDGGAMAMMGGGGMMGRGIGRGPMGGDGFRGQGLPPDQRVWALAEISATGHDGPPLFTVSRGRTIVLDFANRTAFAHAMHIHGHHFRRLNRDNDRHGDFWLDTTLVDVRETGRIAFVADNRGKWMVHCHMLEHMAAGMAAWFEVS